MPSSASPIALGSVGGETWSVITVVNIHVGFWYYLMIKQISSYYGCPLNPPNPWLPPPWCPLNPWLPPPWCPLLLSLELPLLVPLLELLLRLFETGDSDTDISVPVVLYVWQVCWEEFSELTHTSTEFPWFGGIVNVHDAPPDVAAFAWSVYPFAVVMDIPTVGKQDWSKDLTQQ